MANQFPQPYVPAPARVPVKFGLFSVLDFRGAADAHWEGGGVQWQSFDGDAGLGVIGRVQYPQSTTPGFPKQFTSEDNVDHAGVFTLYGQQKITPGPGWSGAQAQQRANDKLVAFEERTAEEILSGAIGNLDPSFDGAPVIGTSDDLIEVIAALEAYLGDHYGSQGVIHLGRRNALLAASRDAVLTVQGNGLFTKLGTPVVAGQGYAEDAAWCTSAMLGYRSDIFESTGTSYDLLDKDTNDLYAIAERTYSIGFESAALAAVTIGDSPA